MGCQLGRFPFLGFRFQALLCNICPFDAFLSFDNNRTALSMFRDRSCITCLINKYSGHDALHRIEVLR